MKIEFIGATHEVTGSCTYLEVCGKHYLVDYGMKQGREIFELAPLPVNPSEISAVFLTHAHIDHSGMLPKLYKNGFRGDIYTTGATKELCGIMLKDAAHILNSEAEWKNKKLERLGANLIEPEYTMDDAIGVYDLFKSVKYKEVLEVNKNVSVCFTDIGHLLGSACVELKLNENGISKTIVFSGDIGNINHQIICDPMLVEKADYVVIESTYGNRLHADDDIKDSYIELASYLQRAFDRGGSVIIPSFAVGRTQEILYLLRGIKENNLVHGHDGFPVYLDSPLAIEATEIFMKCDRAYFDDKMLSLMDKGYNPLMNDDLIFSVTTQDSMAINLEKRSKVIISSSGMCEAGRIRHHLKHNLWNKENIILFVGYQAEGSLGSVIQSGKQIVKIFGEEVAVRAEICKMHGTSGHADRDGLINWLKGFKKKPNVVFVNHGEESSAEAFKDTLIGLGYNAIAPYSGTEFNLVTKVVTVKEPKRLDKEDMGSTRSQMLFNNLMKSVENLSFVAKNLKGCQNRDLTKLTSQINQLLEKWK